MAHGCIRRIISRVQQVELLINTVISVTTPFPKAVLKIGKTGCFYSLYSKNNLKNHEMETFSLYAWREEKNTTRIRREKANIFGDGAIS